MLSSSLDKLLWSNAIGICHVVVFSVSKLYRILHQISDSLSIAVIKKKKAQMHSKGSMCCFSHAFFSVCLSSEYFGVSKNAGLFTSVVWWGILEIIYRLEQRNSKMLLIFTDASVLVYRVVGGLVIVLWWETYSLSKWTEHSDLFGSWKLPARTASVWNSSSMLYRRTSRLQTVHISDNNMWSTHTHREFINTTHRYKI